MTVSVFPVTPSFAAEVGDVDLSQQIEPSDYRAIEDAFAKYAVLIFPDQHLSQNQHLDFARHFGPLDVSIGVHRKDTPLRVRQEIRRFQSRFQKRDLGQREQAAGFPVGRPDVAY